MGRFSLLFALLALLLLGGCAAPASQELPEPAISTRPEEAPPVTPAESEDSAAGEEGAVDLPEGNVAEGTTVEFTREMPVTVDGGRTLTLRLHCRAVASGYGTWDYGVGSMDVLEGDALLQTLSVRDAIIAADRQELEQLAGEGNAWAQESLENSTASEQLLYPLDGWTSCFEDLYLPSIGDLNFDGSEDIRLMIYLGTVNGRYLHWLWNLEAEQFQYAFLLVGYDLQIDTDARQLVTESRAAGYGVYETDYYQYDAEGALRHIRNVEISPPDWEDAREGDFLTTVHEWVDGQWVQTQQTRSTCQP